MTDQRSSPTCYLSEASDIYMGYAGPDELAAALNSLLEDRRASLHASQSLTASMEDRQCCTLLSAAIRQLGATPSRKRSPLYRQAMALADPAQRPDFLKQARQAAARTLIEILPRVRDDRLHARLRDIAQLLEQPPQEPD